MYPLFLKTATALSIDVLAQTADDRKFFFRYVWIVPYLGEHPSLGIIESFITHFITRLVHEVEWVGDCDVVVREIKSPFSVLGRDHGDSPAGFLADVRLQIASRSQELSGRGRNRHSSATGPILPLRVSRSCRNKR